VHLDTRAGSPRHPVKSALKAPQQIREYLVPWRWLAGCATSSRARPSPVLRISRCFRLQLTHIPIDKKPSKFSQIGRRITGDHDQVAGGRARAPLLGEKPMTLPRVIYVRGRSEGPVAATEHDALSIRATTT
jgi:hypothetical protein